MTPPLLAAARELRAMIDATRHSVEPIRTLHQQRLNRAAADLCDRIEWEARDRPAAAS